MTTSTHPHPGTKHLPHSGRALLTVEEAARRLSVGRTTMYALIGAGAIKSVKVGRLRRVPADALTGYVARLGAGQRADAACRSGYPVGGATDVR
jgi:excisionase family DNA binding protein